MRVKIAGLCLAIAGAALVVVPPHAPHASATPTGASGAEVTLVADGVREPHTLRLAPDGRLFLLQQAGRVRVVQRGRLLKAPVLKIDATQIVEHDNSAGLLGIAFPPDFSTAAVQHVYLLYTHEPMAGYPSRHNVVSRWVINGNTIDPASEEILVHLDPLTDDAGAFATSHYGGDMEFGADGKLYISTGDLYQAVNGQSLVDAARQDPSLQRRRHDPGQQPLRGAALRATAGHLVGRVAQPLQAHARPTHRTHPDR